jgi:hypothetical protein
VKHGSEPGATITVRKVSNGVGCKEDLPDSFLQWMQRWKSREMNVKRPNILPPSPRRAQREKKVSLAKRETASSAIEEKELKG